MPSSKSRLNLYFEPGLLRQIGEVATRRRWSKSSVVEAAVAAYFSGDAAERQEAALSRRLDRLSRQLERLERDQRIGVDALAVFVRYWLSVTPALPPSSQSAARAAGRDRYRAFVDAVAREVAKGTGFIEMLEQDLPPARQGES